MYRFSQFSSVAAVGVVALIAGALAHGSGRQSDPQGPYRFSVTGVGVSPGQDAREEFHQTYPLSPDGRISLKNVNGDVRITAWDRNEVKVDAVKTGRTQEIVGATGIAVEARPDAIEIRTHGGNDQQQLAKVDYTVAVPRLARLDSIDVVNGGLTVEGVAGPVRGRSVNGRITARGLAGDVDLSTVNGPIESQFDRVEPGRRVSLKSVNGTLDAALPPAANAVLSARSVRGAIENDFNASAGQGVAGHNLEKTLGSGGTPVTMRTVNGAIRIRTH